MRDRLIALNLAILATLGWTPPEPPEPPEQRLKMCYLLEAHYPNGNTEDDPANYWTLRGKDEVLDVSWPKYYRLYTDKYFGCDGPAQELGEGWRYHFLSNGANNHGKVAFVYKLVPVDGVGG